MQRPYKTSHHLTCHHKGNPTPLFLSPPHSLTFLLLLTHIHALLVFCLFFGSLHFFFWYKKKKDKTKMGDRQPPHQVQVHTQHRYEGGPFKGQQLQNAGGPSTSKILAVLTALPLGGGLLALSGITLVGSLIGLGLSFPVFILFSPVLVPATLLVVFAVTAFLASGAFGLTGLTSMTWATRYVRQATETMPEQLDQAKKRMQDMAGYVGQRTKQVGEEIQRKAQEGK